jgi:hypothetical protein
MLIVLMIVLGLIILGQSSMLWLDRVAQQSGLYRRQEGSAYCADEGVALGRAWVLSEMGAASQLNPLILNPLLADPANPQDLTLPTKDLCQIGANFALSTGIVINGLANMCRIDPQTGLPIYSITLVDDIDEPPPNANPFVDKNNVFMIRSECRRANLEYQVSKNGQPQQDTDVAIVEVNQSGSTPCYGPGSGAGCGT